MTDLTALLEEAKALRASVGVGSAGDSMPVLHDRLLHARGVLDRLEEILATVILVHTRTKEQVADTRYDNDDAWNRIAASPRRNVGLESAPRERYAEYAMHTVKEQVAFRQAEKAERQAGAVVEILRLYHRGVDGVRRDLDSRIRSLAWDLHLES